MKKTIDYNELDKTGDIYDGGDASETNDLK